MSDNNLDIFTIVTVFRAGRQVHTQTHTIEARFEQEACMRAFRDIQLDYPNARAAKELELINQIVFIGQPEQGSPQNTTPFDYEGNFEQVSDEEKQLFQAVASGQNSDQMAVMSCWLDRLPTYAIVAVHEHENDEMSIEPLYLRLTEAMRDRVRSADGERLQTEESPESDTSGEERIDPSLH